MRTIPAGLNLPQLVMLHLENNWITVIPAGLNLPQLEALHLENNWITAIPAGFSLPQLEVLFLSNNEIAAIPTDLNLPQLEYLDLDENYIDRIEYQSILAQFPRLIYLNLNKNPLTQESIHMLREEAARIGRDIEIIADDIGLKYSNPAEQIKPAKRLKT